MSTIVNNRRTASSTKGRQPAPSRNFPPKKNSIDKPVPTEGVYGDARFTHVVYTLVGTNVQVQVKNGKVYEGIFKTISSQMDVVLEVAHLKMEGNGSSCGPTRDTILDKVIFKKDDVVSVTCLSVDLDYAVKDTFTDAAISRGNNGSSYDVELQPWDGEAGEEIGGGLEEGESANGWDVNEMFKTNQEQFSVKSSYDENLSQYTFLLSESMCERVEITGVSSTCTVLNKADTKEYRKREEDARRIAREIERSEDYRKHIDLENGDDEEALFSSVHRPSSTTNQSGEKKYIPPQRRNNNNMTKGQGNNGVDNGSFQQVQRSNHNNKHRQSGVQHHQHQLSPSPQHHHSPQHSHQTNYPPRHQQQHHQQQQQPLAHQQQHQQVKATVVHVTSPPGQQTSQATSNKEEQNNKLNGQENSGTAQDISIAKPTSQSGVSSPVSVPLQQQQQQQQQQESNDNKRLPRQPVNKNTKSAKIDELKEFQDQFKLENQKESDRKTATVEIDNKPETDNKTVDNSNNDNKTNERLDVQPTEEESGEQSGKVTPAKFALNPYAKVFTPNPCSSPARVHPTQSPTPPRPQAQSPVVMPSYMYVHQPPVTRPYQQSKKAVVSAYPNQDPRQAAQHATGQPLLASTLQPQQYLPYIMPSQMIPQQGYTMMNQHARMMNPAAMGPASTTGIDPNQANSQQIYMSQPGPHAIQAHMTQQAIQQSQQQHVAHPAGAPQTPGVQMTQVTGHHPAASPVQHVQGGQANHPGQVPPPAGTPQPLNYSQINLPGHMQGSHNPTSPQTIHASHPYNSHPQFTFSQGQPTSVSHAMSMPSLMPSQPLPVYMMQPPPSNQVQQHQFQTHMTGAPIPGQGGHIMHHGVPGQVQYVPHVPSQGPQVIQYPPGQ
ncbi:hypothetical protein LOTGIDRAFT_228257 [Lottia gigantea]|uniref:Sm domain-containing protein n=1 Tax=Lottia gigantea TaxID=225164 RepID=V4ARY8_LOTGI|nr:hypothetical protein LOTGIDRAFT_228257 [Lottia gigantea]ESO97625.1 hypothetical protein LOTGIDRAFT_228257 [Lottia gigantea]